MEASRKPALPSAAGGAQAPSVPIMRCERGLARSAEGPGSASYREHVRQVSLP